LLFVLLIKKINVVFFKHIYGHNGIPGGGIEEKETFIDTLKREPIEEINCEVIDFGIVGYEIIDYPDVNERKYFGRYWTLVKKLNGLVNDPCGKAIERILVPYEQSAEILNWGEKGKLLLEEAYKNFMEKA